MKNRLAIEQKTLEKMITLYCKENHKKQFLCEDCRSLLDYSLIRLQKCKFGNEKPACKKCTIHCYRHEERTAIRQVMRYSGQRLLFHNPYLAMRYLLK
jgi:hypothetical protein